MSDHWYYTEQSQQRGPVTGSELQQLAMSGRLRPTDLVWRDGLPHWIAASSVEGLFPPQPPSAAAVPPSRTAGDVQSLEYQEPAWHHRADAYERDDEDYRERRRRRRERKAERGWPTGVKVAIGLLAALGVFGILGCAGVIALIVIAANNDGVTYTVTLHGQGEFHEKVIHIPAGKDVHIDVYSHSDRDTDLEIFDPTGRKIYIDDDPAFDAFADFRTAISGNYRIRVINFDGGRNHCTVRYRIE